MSYLYLMPPSVQAHLSPYYKLPYTRAQQSEHLEQHFNANKNPTSNDLMILAAEVGLSEDDVKTWFEHRLACWRQSQGLPPNEASVSG
ncbi:hypothetical protein CHUAL_009315 [Chamberlinius hualienensis]